MMDTIEQLMIELGSEKAKAKSWGVHYDDLHGKYQKLCDALYKIVGLEEQNITIRSATHHSTFV